MTGHVTDRNTAWYLAIRGIKFNCISAPKLPSPAAASVTVRDQTRGHVASVYKGDKIIARIKWGKLTDLLLSGNTEL